MKPVNSGYSYHENNTAHIADSNTSAQDVYIFLQLFFKEFSGKKPYCYAHKHQQIN